jgi:hypothetical protein
MALTRFKTDWRWWTWISLVLFVVAWFIPMLFMKGDAGTPAYFWILLFTHPSYFFETLVFIGMYSLLFSIPAISIGWVLQCVVVMIREARKQKSQNAG